MIKNKKINYGLIIKIELLILVVLAIFGIFRFANSVPAVKETIAMATTRKPEMFTELYFEDHINLPREINLSAQYKFTFTIHNLENKEMKYPYIVYLQRDDQKTILFEDQILIKNNEFKSIEKTIGPLTNFRSKIVVELVDKNQSISFWMDPPLAR